MATVRVNTRERLHVYITYTLYNNYYTRGTVFTPIGLEYSIIRSRTTTRSIEWIYRQVNGVGNINLSFDPVRRRIVIII